MKKLKKKNKFSGFMLANSLFLTAYVLIWLLIFVWALGVSLKDDMELQNNYFGFPQQWLFSNYATVFENMSVTYKSGFYEQTFNIGSMFLNGFLYAAGRAFCSTIIPCITAYATARFKFKFNKVVDIFIIVYLALPIVGGTPSLYQLSRTLGLYNTMTGMWVMQLSALSIYYFIFKAAFVGISNAMFEAGKIEGANNFQLLFFIGLPLVKTTILTVTLLMFVGQWNDYQNPMLFLPSMPTIAYGLYHFNFKTDNELSSWPMKLCGSFIVLVPILVIFLAFQKQFMVNVAIGGVKE